jgi:hypothetical protein
MSPYDRKRAYRRELMLSSIIVASGLVVTSLSLAQLATHQPQTAQIAPHAQIAQATQPLQSTPGAENKPSAPAPASSQTTGARPAEVAPQPARPDSDAQTAGAKPALPPAPAEKTAAPINAK